MADIQKEMITCDSCEIHFLKSGKPEDIPVVLLHGMKFQATTWKELGTLEKIADAGFQAIAMDMPGLAFTRWSAVQESAKLLRRPAIRSVDVGLYCDRYSFLWSGIGLDAFIVNRIKPRRRIQKYFAFLAYAATAVWQAAK